MKAINKYFKINDILISTFDANNEIVIVTEVMVEDLPFYALETKRGVEYAGFHYVGINFKKVGRL